MKRVGNGIALVLLLVFLASVLQKDGPGPLLPGPKPTAVTYVYEKDQHVVPPPVLAALNKLNRDKGIIATVFEQDVKDGTGDVPEQYKLALDAAKKAGLPALVVLNDKGVLRVVKDPKTEDDVLKAVLP